MTSRAGGHLCCYSGPVALGLAAGLSWLKIRNLEQQLVAEKREAAIKGLIADLQIPDEALYYDFHSAREIADIRLKYYRLQGVKKISGDAYVRNLDFYHDKLGGPSFEETSLEEKDHANTDIVVNCSFEQFWANWPTQSPMSRIASDFENDKNLAPYWHQHPEEFNNRVRPYLVRFLQATSPHLRIEACHVLLASGDRSPSNT